MINIGVKLFQGFINFFEKKGSSGAIKNEKMLNKE